MKAKFYMVVESETIAGLEKSMDHYLKNGWRCQGGISWRRDNNEHGGAYIQAMVSEDDNPA